MGDSLSCLQPPFGVVIARTTAVAASPPRPGQYQLDSARVRPDQLSEQVTNFGNSQRKQWSGGLGGIESSLKSRASLLLSTDHAREGMGEQNARDMSIPADPTADFIVIQPHVFAGFKIFVG